MGYLEVKRSQNEIQRFTGSITGTNGLLHRKLLMHKHQSYDTRVVSGLFHFYHRRITLTPDGH